MCGGKWWVVSGSLGDTLIKGQVENEEEMDGTKPELKKWMELKEERRKPGAQEIDSFKMVGMITGDKCSRGVHQDD